MECSEVVECLQYVIEALKVKDSSTKSLLISILAFMCFISCYFLFKILKALITRLQSYWSGQTWLAHEERRLVVDAEMDVP